MKKECLKTIGQKKQKNNTIVYGVMESAALVKNGNLKRHYVTKYNISTNFQYSH